MDKKNHLIGIFLALLITCSFWVLTPAAEWNVVISALISLFTLFLGYIAGSYLYQFFSLQTPLMITACILFIMLSSSFVKSINTQRQEFSPSKEEFMQSAPPELVLTTTALGGLRAIIIDILWLRANKLRDEGKTYEIIQLYDLINKLEPRLPKIWEFTAWEMSYNLSVSVRGAEERWRWVWKGIEQLRDYGIHYNRNAYKLYWQLAFIFYHKLGVDSTDQYSYFYQNELIKIVNTTFGIRQNVKGLVDIPTDFNLLLKHKSIDFLLKKTSKTYISKIVDQMFEKFDVKEIKMLTYEKALKLSEELSLKEEEKKTLFDSFLILQRHWIVKRLWQRLRMTPKKMAEIEKKYIKIDWRLAAAHSLYWAQDGVDILNRKSKEWRKEKEVEVQNMNRLRFNALREIFEYGFPIAFMENKLMCIPNFNVIEPLHQVFIELKEVWGERDIVSHEEFLRNVVKTCYVYGKKDLAQKYYDEMKKLFKNPLYKRKNLEEYVVIEIARKINGWGRRHEIETYIVGFLVRGYSNLFWSGTHNKNKEAAKFQQFSRLVYKKYIERHGSITEEDKKPKTYDFFVKTAQRFIKVIVKQRYDEKNFESIWQQLKNNFPGVIIID